MKDSTDQSEALAFGSSEVTVGVSWTRSLDAGETPKQAIGALLQSVGKARRLTSRAARRRA
jgi:hypothetical protein